MFHTFGCLCFPYLHDYAKHKFEPRSLPCIFLGYNTSYKGFQCLDPISHRVFVTMYARFNETVFPFLSSNMQPSSALSDFIFFHDPCVSNSSLSGFNSSADSQSSQHTSESPPCKSCALELDNSHVSALPLPSPNTSSIEVISDMPPPSNLRSSTQNSHSMITHEKAGISKTKHSNYVC